MRREIKVAREGAGAAWIAAQEALAPSAGNGFICGTGTESSLGTSNPSSTGHLAVGGMDGLVAAVVVAVAVWRSGGKVLIVFDGVDRIWGRVDWLPYSLSRTRIAWHEGLLLLLVVEVVRVGIGSLGAVSRRRSPGPRRGGVAGGGEAEVEVRRVALIEVGWVGLWDDGLMLLWLERRCRVRLRLLVGEDVEGIIRDGWCRRG